MPARPKNEVPTIIRETVMIVRDPYLSTPQPTMGDSSPEMRPIESDRFIWVRVQPNSCSSGSTNMPKPYWEPPDANAVVKNEAQTIAQPRDMGHRLLASVEDLSNDDSVLVGCSTAEQGAESIPVFRMLVGITIGFQLIFGAVTWKRSED
jgi:hypothetical protein